MDCNNMIAYMLEEKRMCEWHYKKGGCEKCPLSNNSNCSCQKLFNNQTRLDYVTESHMARMIEKVQKWSDEHNVQ